MEYPNANGAGANSPKGREAEFLLALASASSADRREHLGRLLAEPSDWERLMLLAGEHGLMPPMYRWLSDGLAERVPSAVMRELRMAFHANALRSTHLARELVRLADLFARRGVPVLTFKGPVLAMLAYGDLAMRAFSDIDLLVKQQDIGAARELLASAGYAREFPAIRPELSELLPLPEETFRHESGLAVVDLHWGMAPHYYPYAGDIAGMFERSSQVELEGGRVNALGRDDHLLHLFFHATKDGWQTLGAVRDVAGFIRYAEDLDWAALMERASRGGSRRMLLVGAQLVHDLLEVPIPGFVLEAALRDAGTQAAVRRVRHRLTKRPTEGFFQEWMVPMYAVDGLWTKLHYMLGRSLAPTFLDCAWVAIPRRLFPLYYGVRILRIGAEGARLAFRAAGNRFGAKRRSRDED